MKQDPYNNYQKYRQIIPILPPLECSESFVSTYTTRIPDAEPMIQIEAWGVRVLSSWYIHIQKNSRYETKDCPHCICWQMFRILRKVGCWIATYITISSCVYHTKGRRGSKMVTCPFFSVQDQNKSVQPTKDIKTSKSFNYNSHKELS